MEEIIHFQFWYQQNAPGSHRAVEDFSISRERLLSCWENYDYTIRNIERGIGRHRLANAIQECIRIKYRVVVELRAIIDTLALKNGAGIPARGLEEGFNPNPWTTEALMPYARFIQDAKAVSVI
jgi:hypothetical protein